MKDQHPAKHPVVYFSITVCCAAVGYIIGSRTVFRDTGASLASTGLVYGALLGVLLSVIWSLLITLADL